MAVLFQYQQKAEPPSQDVLNPVAWLQQALVPLRRVFGPARYGSSFVFVPVFSVGGGVERIVLGQKESFSVGVNPSIGSGAIFG